MLHKAPSAFGLTTFLLHDRFSHRAIRQHLLIFSAAAPIAALFTFGILSQLDLKDPSLMQIWGGLILLFSAGTFLYVATVHILPEVYTHNHSERRLSKTQMICILAGLFLPLFITIDHSH
jgi:zinc transporter 9